MLEQLNWTDLIVAVVAGYFAFLQAKKAKEPDSNKLILDKYDQLYALVEKQRNEQTENANKLRQENSQLLEQVSSLTEKVKEFEEREALLRQLIKDLTGLSFEQYLKNLKQMEEE